MFFQPLSLKIERLLGVVTWTVSLLYIISSSSFTKMDVTVHKFIDEAFDYSLNKDPATSPFSFYFNCSIYKSNLPACSQLLHSHHS
jgi:hypothetical protein